MFNGGIWVYRASIAQRIAPKEGFEGFVAISCGAMPFQLLALRGPCVIMSGFRKVSLRNC